MENKRTLIAQSESDIWNGLNNDFTTGIPNNYHVEIQYDGHIVDLDMVSSPGGGDEGGYEYTTLSSRLSSTNDFEFSIQPEDFLNRLGKMFGGQDVELGYEEFDKKVLIKTNNPERLKHLLSDNDIRQFFVGLSGYSFGVATSGDNNERTLELHLQHKVSGNDIKRLYQVFTKTLSGLNTSGA